MTRIMTWTIAAALLLTFSTVAMAGDKQQRRDRKRDGSCQSIVAVQDADQYQTRQRDRKRDGSCEDGAQAGQREGKGKRQGPQDGSGPRRDGSCN